MSDRASTEKLFNNLFTQYRGNFCSKLVENWSDLSDSERNIHLNINHFFCGLHLLTGLADKSASELKKFEEMYFKTYSAQTFKTASSFLPNGPGCVRLVRTICKAFTKGGDEKSGCYLPFKLYLKSLGISKLPLTPFHGNRENRLTQSIFLDIKIPLFHIECQALGLIDKLITAPLWRILENENDSVLANLTKFDSDLTFNSTLIHILEVLFAEFRKYIAKILLEYRDDFNPSCSSSAMPHNKLPETVFSHLDRLMRI
ncbi:uncharacterized protein LOC130012338, partial [Patella vulgata]|uniref:uncharacterized protein LOC130012338 n=1 Tax=Patella vulgata TaxID=6465 RepID=UPI0024A8D74A